MLKPAGQCECPRNCVRNFPSDLTPNPLPLARRSWRTRLPAEPFGTEKEHDLIHR